MRRQDVSVSELIATQKKKRICGCSAAFTAGVCEWDTQPISLGCQPVCWTHFIKVQQNGIQRKQTPTLPLHLNTSRFQQVNYFYLEHSSHFIDFPEIKQICTSSLAQIDFQLSYLFMWSFFYPFFLFFLVAELQCFLSIDASHLIHPPLYSFSLNQSVLFVTEESDGFLRGILMAAD